MKVTCLLGTERLGCSVLNGEALMLIGKIVMVIALSFSC